MLDSDREKDEGQVPGGINGPLGASYISADLCMNLCKLAVLSNAPRTRNIFPELRLHTIHLFASCLLSSSSSFA